MHTFASFKATIEQAPRRKQTEEDMWLCDPCMCACIHLHRLRLQSSKRQGGNKQKRICGCVTRACARIGLQLRIGLWWSWSEQLNKLLQEGVRLNATYHGSAQPQMLQ